MRDGHKMSKSKGNVIDPLDIVDGIELEALRRQAHRGLMQPQLAPRHRARHAPAISRTALHAHGTDALRFTFASLATQSREIRFDLARVGGYRNFCNKLWNAARFVTWSVDGPGEHAPHGAPMRAFGRRSLDPLAPRPHTRAASRGVRPTTASTLPPRALYEFTWYDFCDWYLEIAKTGAAGRWRHGPPRRRAARAHAAQSSRRCCARCTR